MKVHFVKMHGLGNDVAIVDSRDGGFALSPEQIRVFADRHRGVGFDQLLCLDRAPNADVDFALRVFNADGGQVQQCGNGTRCIGRYIQRLGLSDKRHLRILSSGRVLEVRTQASHDPVKCDMGRPMFESESVPINATRDKSGLYRLDTEAGLFEVGAVSMGNPHVVLQVEDVSKAPVAELGPILENHPSLPERANVGFMQIVDSRRIRLRVFERGVGETSACGTGACAAVAVGHTQGWLDDEVDVVLSGGELSISWGGGSASLWMSGPAEWVYEGTINL